MLFQVLSLQTALPVSYILGAIAYALTQLDIAHHELLENLVIEVLSGLFSNTDDEYRPRSDQNDR